jgi:hypothetical protein|nr:MAG TPA: tail fiber protein [Caudoviricetes sp.]
MALPADFSKIFGSTATGGLTPIGDVNYAKGWEFVGSNPPTKNDFSYLQNLSDLKSQWLYSNKLQRVNPFGDIKSDGAVHTALENLGLGDGSALPVGVPVPWPLSTPPTGWLKCNGSSFSLTDYPVLAAVFPSGVLPDLRGEFIRGWDDGRNVDAGRALLSQQGDAIQKISGTVTDNAMGLSASGSGAMTITGESGITYYASATPSSSYIYYKKIGIDSSLVARTANENRPRNIAFNYIVRAA